MNRILTQTKILNFLDLQEKQNQAPDLLDIMNNISRQGNDDPVDIVKSVKELQQKLKIIKVRIGINTTYRLVRNL